MTKEVISCDSFLTHAPNPAPVFTMEDYAKAEIAIFWDINSCNISYSTPNAEIDKLRTLSVYDNVVYSLQLTCLQGEIFSFEGCGNEQKENTSLCLGSNSIELVLFNPTPSKDATNPSDTNLNAKKMMSRMLDWMANSSVPANIVLILSDVDYMNVLEMLDERRGYGNMAKKEPVMWYYLKFIHE